MVSRAAEDRAARTILLLAILLAAVLVGLSLTSTNAGEDLQADGEIDFGRTDNIRVLLTRVGSGPYDLELPDGARIQAGSADFSGRLQVQRLDDGLRIGGRLLSAPLRTEPGQSFQLNGESYRGRLTFDPQLASGRPILSLPIEQYLAQVLPGEMPMSYPEEALAAQVIAARSFAAWRMSSRKSRSFDVSDSETSQMFEPLSQQTARAKRLVARSRGLVLTSEQKILPAYYSANCGGETRSNGEAFGEEKIAALRGSSCGYCQWSRHYHWTAKLPAAEVGDWFQLGGPVVSATVQESAGSNYEPQLRLRGPEGTKSIRARDLKRRSKGRLKSSFIIGAEVEGAQLLLSGRGFGHGVGLCQNGARGLALAGQTAVAILAHYYPGAKLQQLHSTETP